MLFVVGCVFVIWEVIVCWSVEVVLIEDVCDVLSFLLDSIDIIELIDWLNVWVGNGLIVVLMGKDFVGIFW